MDRWILAFWVVLGGVGLYHVYHQGPLPSLALVQPMDGGVVPPSEHGSL